MRDRIPKCYSYLRISSSKQDLASQRLEITNYAKQSGLEIEGKFELEMSATKNGLKKRKIPELLKVLGKGDKLITSELSRLGRSMQDISYIAAALRKKGVEIHCVKQGFILKDDISSKSLVWALGFAAEVESDLISKRVKAGMQAAKARGVKFGNPAWSTVRDKRVRKENADRFARSLEKTIRGYQVQGMTQREMVDALNEAGIKPRRGQRFYLATVQSILKRLEERKERR
jgi:DNA invertase Pin-like site-specific DNA recombinase